jgi:hypothetical protein
MTTKKMSVQQSCMGCRFFNNHPERLEQSIVGLRIMGSGYSSVVGNDGLCDKLGRYLSGDYLCDQYELVG